MDNNIKHSKYKNTYLIYEFLVRKVTEEAMNGISLNESNAFKIINKYYSRGVLKEEFSIYKALLETTITNKYSVEFLISESLKMHRNLSQKKLRTERYNLIKEIKEHYNLENLFSTKLEDYKKIASTYILLESNLKNEITTKSVYMGLIMENIMNPKTQPKTIKILEAVDKASPEQRKLAYMMMINSFNKKYGSLLNENQKKFIQDYIYSNTTENNWVLQHITKIKSESKKYLNKLDSSTDEADVILKIKLSECVNKMRQLEKKKIYNQDDHAKILNFYKLFEYLD
jgi:hypothetical protein